MWKQWSRFWARHACRRLWTHLETRSSARTHTHARKQKSLLPLHTFQPTYPWPSHKHTQRDPHSTLYKIVTHSSSPPTPPCMSHKPSPLSVFLFFSPFLPRLFSLFSWISGESNYISVGLTAWRWRAVWLWANTWPWLEERSRTRSRKKRRRRCSVDRCAAGSLGYGEA